MSDAPDPASGDPTDRPECPRCGRSMVAATVVGPTEGYAAPCGCAVPPESLPGP